MPNFIYLPFQSIQVFALHGHPFSAYEFLVLSCILFIVERRRLLSRVGQDAKASMVILQHFQIDVF